MPRAGFEPAHLSAPPPQDGVSTSSTTWALLRGSSIRTALTSRNGFQPSRSPILPTARAAGAGRRRSRRAGALGRRGSRRCRSRLARLLHRSPEPQASRRSRTRAAQHPASPAPWPPRAPEPPPSRPPPTSSGPRTTGPATSGRTAPRTRPSACSGTSPRPRPPNALVAAPPPRAAPMPASLPGCSRMTKIMNTQRMTCTIVKKVSMAALSNAPWKGRAPYTTVTAG